MRTVIAVAITSLDSFYTGPDDNPLVLNMDASFDAYNLERMRAAGTVLLGRASFEMFGGFWPMVADAPADPANPVLSEGNREFSRRYREIPKLVVSDSLTVPADHPWADTTEVVERAMIGARLAAEKATGDGDIVIFGSHRTWTGLLDGGLLDELHLIVGPAAIGAGRPLFTGPAVLALGDCRRLGEANALLRYRTRP